MDINRTLLEAELKALMEVSSDFSRGLSTVAARMRVLKSCLDKSHGGHVSRVDRATSPIVFRTHRGTSISPLRFKSPVKVKEEQIDIHEEPVTDIPHERVYCDINVNQEESALDQNIMNSINNHSQKETSVVREYPNTLREMHQEQPMEVSCDVTSPESSNNSSATVTIANQIVTVPLENSLNVRKSYYVINQTNGMAIPIDVSQIKELGLSKKSIQQITVQPTQTIEEDILYAMQANKMKRDKSIDSCSIVAKVGQEILISSEEENETQVISERVFASRFASLKRNQGIRKRTLQEKREYNRLRQKKYRDKHRKGDKGDGDTNESINPTNVENNLNSTSRVETKNADAETATHNVLILRKELIRKTYARNQHVGTS